MKFSTKKLFAVISAISVATLVGCNTGEPVQELEPEVGDFKLVLSNSATTGISSRAFWEEPNAFGNSDGDPSEKAISMVTLFGYMHEGIDTETCIIRREFTNKEVNPTDGSAPTAVFSLNEDYPAGTKFDFYAVTNCKVPDEYTRTELKALMQHDLIAYINPNYNVTKQREQTIQFSSFYTNNDYTRDINSLRKSYNNPLYGTAEDEGDGFVMSGVAEGVEKRAVESNQPVVCSLKVDRVVAKMEVKISIGDGFVQNYQNVLGSTIVINSVTIKNVITHANLIAVDQAMEPITVPDYSDWTKFNVIDVTQLPVCNTKDNSTNKSDWEYYSHFYVFPNVGRASASTATIIVADEAKPVLCIDATYDADGQASTTGDISKLSFETLLLTEQVSRVTRNNYYRIDVEINGLSSEQAVARIYVEDWKVVDEKISLGN